MKISNRVFLAGTFLTGCTILSAGLCAQQDIQKFTGAVQAPTVRATRFEVIDAAGRVKAQIGTRPDGTVYTVGINTTITPVGPATSATSTASAIPAQDAVRAALAAQQQDNQLLQLRLEQERQRLEQERIRRDQERLRMNQPSATP